MTTQAEKKELDAISLTLAAKIRAVRENYHMSRPVFAAALGIPATSLKNYELGYRSVRGHVIVRLANHEQFGKHINYLLNDKAEVTNVNWVEETPAAA